MRTITEIYEALKQDYFDASGMGLAEGGDMSLRLMAVAAEMFSLEAQCDFAMRQAFPQTASGEYLDRHAEVRAIRRREGVKARGVLRFSLNESTSTAVEIPAGTQCMNGAGELFISTAAAAIPAGELSCEVEACAEKAGEAGNAAAGSITRMRKAPTGVSAVTNPSAFTGGSDEESDEELRTRIMSSYRKLPNGANAAYYEALALSVPGVEKVVVMPRKRGRGTVDIVFSAAYGCPEDELVDKVREMLGQCREICVDVDVSAPTTRTVNVTAALTVGEGYSFSDVKSRAEDALRAYFGGDKLGESVYAAKLTSILMAVEGVENCVLTAPAEDIAASDEVLPVIGTVSISQAV